MWVTRHRLRRLGFRRVSPRYWLCFRRYGLTPDSHLTIPARTTRDLLELCAFHVTFERLGERVHFYYREEGPACWRLEGHTPSTDLRRLGTHRDHLQPLADAVAERLVVALDARWLPSTEHQR